MNVITVAPRGLRYDTPPKCVGFEWIGQTLQSCDECGRPLSEHIGFKKHVGPIFGGQHVIVLDDPYPQETSGS